MASSSSPSIAPCNTCSKRGAGIFRCEGCLQVFCRIHLNEHRDFLGHQLDEITLQHDSLLQTIIENKNKENSQFLILKQIDQWEKDSIGKIQQLAQDIRQQLIDLTTSHTVSKELCDLAERLQEARINDDYVEKDLQTWTAILQKLKDDVNTLSSSICIQEDPKEILVAKLHLTIIKDYVRRNERFGESFGTVHIEKNGLVATHCGTTNSSVYVRGIGEYSSNKQKIRFLFKKNSTKYITSFRIVPKRMQMREIGSDSVYSGYGWTSNDNLISSNIDVEIDKNFRDMKDQTTFEIEFELDCDNRKISYVNQQTKKRRELNVDITKCPFPWQLEFYLYEIGDYVRFLP